METDYRKYEPFFGSWKIVKEIGEGSYGAVYEVQKETFGHIEKSALKIVSIPRSKSEYLNTLSEGQTEEGASEYYKDVAAKMFDEIKLMSRLGGKTNIVDYKDSQTIEHEDHHGWDIIIRMELLRPLTQIMKEKTAVKSEFSEDEVIKLGIDMVKALQECRKHNIIHRDIKPANIFVSEDGNYKLGDFGVARTLGESRMASSRAGTPYYEAPEIVRGEKYDYSIDIYSLGMILYQLLNRKRLPFYPLPPAPILSSDREKADQNRLRGVKIPKPVDASEHMSRIILRMIAFSSADRYQRLEDLMADLSGAEDDFYGKTHASANPIDIGKSREEKADAADNGGVDVVKPDKIDDIGTEYGHQPQGGRQGEPGHGMGNNGPYAGGANMPVQPPNAAGHTSNKGLIAGLSIFAAAMVIVLCFVFFAIKPWQSDHSGDDLFAAYNDSLSGRVEDRNAYDGNSSTSVTETAPETETVPAPEPEPEAVPEPVPEPVTEPVSEPVAAEADATAIFQIRYDGEISEYSAVLDPNQYYYYANGTPEFGFYYPAWFYNDVTERTSGAGMYGNIIDEINFTSNDGSYLTVAVMSRTDGQSLEAVKNIVHDTEMSNINSGGDIQNKVSADGSLARLILTGYEGNSPFYDIIKITNDKIYKMRIVVPPYGNDDDKNMKKFFTECMYRGCAFSGSTKPFRSYADFLTNTN